VFENRLIWTFSISKRLGALLGSKVNVNFTKQDVDECLKRLKVEIHLINKNSRMFFEPIEKSKSREEPVVIKIEPKIIHAKEKGAAENFEISRLNFIQEQKQKQQLQQQQQQQHNNFEASRLNIIQEVSDVYNI
jgi:hypothetical protein